MKTSKYIQTIENIHKELMKCDFSENIGLHAGTSGIALFLLYYDRIILKKNDISPRIMKILEHNIECINLGRKQHSICNGISGFGWLCEHLLKLEMLDRDDIEFLDDLDPFLHRQMIIDIKEGNYDFLHGALGVGTYFLSRFDHKEIPLYLEELLTELEKSAIHSENSGIKWESVIEHETGKKGYNISLSHGISSIAAFLIRLYKMHFESERVNILLTGSVKYILDQISNEEGCFSCFPSLSKENNNGNYHSRLGWCYGDLGISSVVLQAAFAMKNKEWENVALNVFRHAVNRRDLQANSIFDAGICHGSVGVAYIFKNLYQNTHIQEFSETIDYWMNVTLQMAKYDDGLAGYKAWRTEEYGSPEKSEFLLEGIAGIGLAILSYMNSNELDWDECLMLS